MFCASDDACHAASAQGVAGLTVPPILVRERQVEATILRFNNPDGADEMNDMPLGQLGSGIDETVSALIACPHDHAGLSMNGQGVECSHCGKTFAAEGKFVDFMGIDDAFYEDKYLNMIRFNPKPGFFQELPLWLLLHGYVWAVRRFVRPGSTVVELGCAGGIRWFGSRYKMIGVDLAATGLRAACGHYEAGLRSNALHLPLADTSVDAVVSACFFEHIA
ncbi:MAG: hypothetical protein RL367_2602, partial [Pseudomonadota bacterium]